MTQHTETEDEVYARMNLERRQRLTQWIADGKEAEKAQQIVLDALLLIPGNSYAYNLRNKVEADLRETRASIERWTSQIDQDITP